MTATTSSRSRDGPSMRIAGSARFRLERRGVSRTQRRTGSASCVPGEAIGDVDQDALKRQHDPPHDRGASRERTATAPAWDQGAQPVLHRWGRALPQIRCRRQLDRRATMRSMFEEEYRKPRRGMPDYQHVSSTKWISSPTPLKSTTAISRIDKKGDLDRHRREQPGQPRQRGARVQPDHEGQGEAARLRYEAEFIFSHSALREGWDNPNVFQICAIAGDGTERERRQTIGRGLRLCVNQEGERVRGFDTNTLTVIATESYEHSPRTSRRKSKRTPAFGSASLSPASSRPSRSRMRAARHMRSARSGHVRSGITSARGGTSALPGMFRTPSVPRSVTARSRSRRSLRRRPRRSRCSSDASRRESKSEIAMNSAPCNCEKRR